MSRSEAFAFALVSPRKSRLAPLHFEYLFLRGKLGLGTGMAVRFAKAPAGIYAFIVETKRDSAKEGGWPRLVPWKDHRLVISRSAALSPCLAETSKYLTPFIFLKSEGGQEIPELDLPASL
jgi:hypothetical protein